MSLWPLGHELQFLVITWCGLCGPSHHMSGSNLLWHGGLVWSGSSASAISHQATAVNCLALSKDGDPKISTVALLERVKAMSQPIWSRNLGQEVGLYSGRSGHRPLGKLAKEILLGYFREEFF